jgi:hypothetical protein
MINVPGPLILNQEGLVRADGGDAGDPLALEDARLRRRRLGGLRDPDAAMDAR